MAGFTTNGGSSWSRAKFPSRTQYLEALWCLSSSRCVAVGNAGTCTSGACQYSGPGVVDATTDAGVSWSSVPIPAHVTGLNALSCPTPSRCIALGSNGQEGAAIYTSNGGISWSEQASTTWRTLGYMSGIACPSTNTCVAVGDGGGTQTPIAFTINGGASWQKA